MTRTAIDPATAARLTRSAAFASIATALVLAGLKGWATWLTGSTAMLGSLADSALDLVASGVTLAGVWVAAQPADRNHRFGHGKAEALSAMVQIILITLSAGAIAFRGMLHLLEGAATQAAEEGIAVSLVAIVLTFALIGWQRHVVRRTGSLAIGTDSVHYQSDLLLNLAVIAALVLDQFAGLGAADPLFAFGIAGWLLFNAWRASRAAIDSLMDREWPEDKRLAFIAAAARHPEIARLHDLRTRTSGNHDFAQFHVDLPARLSVGEAHAIIERLERALEATFPGLELLIHIDPAGHVDDPGNPLVEENQFRTLPGAPLP